MHSSRTCTKGHCRGPIQLWQGGRVSQSVQRQEGRVQDPRQQDHTSMKGNQSNDMLSLPFAVSKGSIFISLPVFLFFGNLIPPLGYNLWSFPQPYLQYGISNHPAHPFLPVPLVSQGVENWPSVVKVKPIPSPMSDLCYDTSKLSVILYSSTTSNTQV